MRITYQVSIVLALVFFIGCSKSNEARSGNPTESSERNALQEYINTPIDSAKRLNRGVAERDEGVAEQVDSLDESYDN